jgi:hypothetical protein
MPYPGRRALGRKWREERPKVLRPVPEHGRARRPVGDPQKWLNTVYRLCDEQKFNPAIDLVLDTLDDLLSERDVEMCNNLLKRVDVKQLPTVVLLAFLAETARAREQLTARSELYRKVEEKLLTEKPRAKVDALLGSLK